MQITRRKKERKKKKPHTKKVPNFIPCLSISTRWQNHFNLERMGYM